MCVIVSSMVVCMAVSKSISVHLSKVPGSDKTKNNGILRMWMLLLCGYMDGFACKEAKN